MTDYCGTGTLKPGPMITSTIKLEDVVESGIKALIKDKDSHVKIMVEVGGQ
jgi:threonine dehydrogenase-like Zn-dependent dehydrogenase